MGKKKVRDVKGGCRRSAVATDEENVKRDQKDVCSTHFISRPWGALARQDTSMADVIRSVFDRKED